MTIKDQIIDEIRQARREISAECGHDLRAFAAYMEKQTALFAPQIAAWRKIEREHAHAIPNHLREDQTSVVAEEPPRVPNGPDNES